MYDILTGLKMTTNLMRPFSSSLVQTVIQLSMFLSAALIASSVYQEQLAATSAVNYTSDYKDGLRLSRNDAPDHPPGSSREVFSSRADYQTVQVIKQRRMKGFPTSYDMIPQDSGDSETDVSKYSSLRNLMQPGNNTHGDAEEFKKNLELLKKVVKKKRKQMKLLEEGQQGKTGTSTAPEVKNATLEEDINTINVLISMLLVANSKLIEQRERQAGNYTSQPANREFVDGKPEKKKSNGEVQLASASSELKKTELKHKISTKSPMGPTSAIKSQGKQKKVKSSDEKVTEKKSTTEKHPKGRKGTQVKRHNDTDTVNQAAEDSSVELTTRLRRPSDSKKTTKRVAEDVSLVRPGFNKKMKVDKSASASKVTKTKVKVKSDKIDSMKQSSAGYRPGDMFYAIPPTSGPEHLDQDLLHNHEPLVARDLLHVRPQAGSTGSPQNPAIGGPQIVNMFVARPSAGLDRHPLYDHFRRQQEILGISPTPYGPISSTPNSGSEDEEQTPLVVPPYNGHRVDTMQKAPLKLDDRDIGLWNHFGPQTSTGAPGSLPPGESGPVERPQPVNDELYAGNPIHQMLLAAKKQQAAALAYERRRLEYETELRRREEAMRRQHDENLRRQREEQEHQQRMQAVKTKLKQEPQPESNGSDGAGGNDANENQNQQSSNESAEGNVNEDPRSQGGQEENHGEADDQNNDNQSAQQAADDPDLKGFQNFANTDFTDLFPPGILSDAEIKEMRKQQQDQKLQAEQEEREKQQQAQEDQGSAGANENGQQTDQQEEPAQQEEQPQLEQQQEQEPPTKKTNEISQQPTTGNNSSVKLEPKQPDQQPSQQTLQQPTSANTTSVAKTLLGVQSEQRQQHQLDPNLPRFLFRNVSLNFVNDGRAGRANKKRRSQVQASMPELGDEHRYYAAPTMSDQQLIGMDSKYHDRYIKPFLVAVNSQVEETRNQEGWQAVDQRSSPPPPLSSTINTIPAPVFVGADSNLANEDAEITDSSGIQFDDEGTSGDGGGSGSRGDD